MVNDRHLPICWLLGISYEYAENLIIEVVYLYKMESKLHRIEL